MRLGQAFQADVVNAFATSVNYRRGALFVIYDEWGGFFDHVRPGRVPDDRASTDLNEDFGQLGFRVPAVAVSPYTRNKGATERGRFGGWWYNPRYRVDHGRYAHESILSFISYRFGLGFLNKRHKYANNIGHSFDFWGKPDLEPAELPDPPAIVTQPCALGGQDVEDSLETHQQRHRAPRADRGEAEGSRLRGHAGQDLHQAGHGEEGHRGRSLSALLI